MYAHNQYAIRVPPPQSQIPPTTSKTEKRPGFNSYCDLRLLLLQLQEAHAAEQKKLSSEMEEVRAQMKKTQLRAEEVHGTFETHNGEYLRMKV